MRFSVIVLTYNPAVDKVISTLKSIISQDYDDYEIVISDDGSENNHFNEIKRYLDKKGFDRYVLVPHEKNQGTVKNIISALEHCSGELIKAFGPGDLLYCKNTLRELDDFFVTSGCEGCFGMLKGYYRNKNNEISFRYFEHPFDINAYRSEAKHGENEKLNQRMIKNLVLYSDNASGAATVFKKSYYLHYLKQIEDYVVYQEDIFQVLAALEERNFKIFDKYVVYYEMGDGVSTGTSQKFQELLRKDVDSFYNMLAKRFPDNKIVQKRKKLMVFYKIKNLYVRTILRSFANPDAVRYLISSMEQKRKKRHRPEYQEKGFLG